MVLLQSDGLCLLVSARFGALSTTVDHLFPMLFPNKQPLPLFTRHHSIGKSVTLEALNCFVDHSVFTTVWQIH